MKNVWIRLLGRVSNARLRDHVEFNKWQKELFRKAPELYTRYETELQLRRQQVPFDQIREPIVRDWVIVLQWQNGLLQKKVADLILERAAELQRDYEERFDEPYGAAMMRCYALGTKDPAQKLAAEANLARLNQDFLHRKRRKLVQEIERHRHRKLKHRLAGEWFSPMTQQEYAASCGVNVKTVQRFLSSIGAKPLPLEAKGRGRPVLRYPFATNLKVLQQFLREWLPHRPEDIVDTFMANAAWLASCDDPEGRHRKVRPLLLKHLRAAAEQVVDRELLQELKWPRKWLSASDAEWTGEICPAAKRCLRVVDTELAQASPNPLVDAMLNRP